MLSLSDPVPWMQQAACAGRDQFVHYPEADFTREGLNKQQRLALHMCFGCPVRLECLRYAIENREAHGVWGGTLEADRQPAIRSLRRHGPQEARREVELVITELDTRASLRARTEGLMKETA